MGRATVGERERASERAGQRGYREDLIVLWHPQNDIIAVRFVIIIIYRAAV